MSRPEEIAAVVADAAESPDRRFRWRAGADAEAVLALRARLDDVEFDKAFRAALKLDW